MTTYYNINIVKAHPGGCCQFHYWNCLSSYSTYNKRDMRNILSDLKMKTNKAKPVTKLGFVHTIQPWARAYNSLITTTYILGRLDPCKLKQTMALTKDDWYKILAAQACLTGGFLFLVDNITERGDFISSDLNIRSFARWLSRRAKTYGRVASVPKVTAREHIKCWIFSPHEINVYDPKYASTPHGAAIIEAGNILTETANRRLKGEM